MTEYAPGWSPDEVRAERRKRGRLAVIESLAIRGLPTEHAPVAIADTATAQGVSEDDLLERIGMAGDAVAFFEAMVRA